LLCGLLRVKWMEVIIDAAVRAFLRDRTLYIGTC